MNPDELCICTHTHEDHSGGGCSRRFHNGRPCPCKEFALIDAGVDIYEALKGLLAYLREFWPMEPLFSTYDDRQAMEIADAEAAIRKAKGE